MNSFKDIPQAIYFLLPYFEPRKTRASLSNRLREKFENLGVDPDSIKFNKLLSVETNKGVFIINEIIADGEKNRRHGRNLIKKL